MKSYLTTTGLLLVITPSLFAQQMPPAPTLEQVLDNYPSRAELQSRVDEYKTAHAAEFAASRADFDLAIRSMLTLEFPESPYAHRRHVKRKPRPLPNYFSRSTVLDQIAKATQNGHLEIRLFYEQHIEEIVVDETPSLRYVYLDVLLNGWDDWSNWQGDELQEIRQKYPDLHVKYALKDIGRFRNTWDDLNFVADTFGVVLPLVLDTDRGQWVCEEATDRMVSSARVRKDPDLLRYCLDAAASATDRDTRMALFRITGPASGALRQPEYREFWVDYLQHPDEWVRTKAVAGILDSIRKPRPGEEPRPRDAELAQMLYEVLQNDPSPRVRNFLQPRLEQYERSDTKPKHRGGKISEPPQPLSP
jgi:hypothetical protein